LGRLYRLLCRGRRQLRPDEYRRGTNAAPPHLSTIIHRAEEPLIMKTKLLRMLAGINANVLVALGIASLVAGPALATTLTITPLQNLPPRVMTTQQTHYVRFAIDFGDCPLRAADTACSYRVASLPYNAFLVSISSRSSPPSTRPRRRRSHRNLRPVGWPDGGIQRVHGTGDDRRL